MSEHMMPIPSRIYNAAVGGHVAGADQIIDDETGLTLDKVTGGALEEKTYTSGSNDGMGRVVLRKNLVEGVNTLTQAMINKSNTIYVIQYDFTLASNITIPVNCVLEFDGGSISASGSNDTITGTNTGIKADILKIFNTDLIIAGSWNVVEAYPEWFDAKGDGNSDDTNSVNRVLNAFRGKKIVFSEYKTYKIDTVIVYSNTIIEINGTIASRSSHGCCFEFFDRVTSTPGYSGVHDVIVCGKGTVDYMYDTYGGLATVFRIHHCKNITIKGLTCINTGKEHVIESGGTDGLYVYDLTIYSSLDSTDNGECIQLECVSEAGTSGAIPYDSTPTKNVLIDNCTFIKDTRTSAPYRFVGGNHPEDSISNVIIQNCRFIGDSSNVTNKLITINGSTNNYLIKGCIFENFNKGNCIYITRDYDNHDLTENYRNKNIIITNCLFNNIRGGIANRRSCRNLSIINNQFISTVNNGGSPICFWGTEEDDVTLIANNVFDGTQNCVYHSDYPKDWHIDIHNLYIINNIFKNVLYAPIIIWPKVESKNIVIKNNVFNGYRLDTTYDKKSAIFIVSTNEVTLKSWIIENNSIYLTDQSQCEIITLLNGGNIDTVLFKGNQIFNTSILDTASLNKLYDCINNFKFKGTIHKADTQVDIQSAYLL